MSKVFPPTEYEMVNGEDGVCFHALQTLEINDQEFTLERICGICFTTLEKEKYQNLKELLFDASKFIDNPYSIDNAIVVTKG